MGAGAWARAHGRGRMGAGEVACDAKVGPLVAVLRLVLSASSVYCSQIPMYCSYHHTGTGTGTGVLLLGCHVQRQTVATAEIQHQMTIRIDRGIGPQVFGHGRSFGQQAGRDLDRVDVVLKVDHNIRPAGEHKDIHPDASAQDIVAIPAIQAIRPGVAVQNVVARVAVQRVRAVRPRQGVIVIAAIQQIVVGGVLVLAVYLDNLYRRAAK